MKKLRVLVTAALLTLTLGTLNAADFTAPEHPDGMSSTQSQTGWCWFYFMGRWYYLPC
jgi:hypothetical protein